MKTKSEKRFEEDSGKTKKVTFEKCVRNISINFDKNQDQYLADLLNKLPVNFVQ